MEITHNIIEKYRQLIFDDLVNEQPHQPVVYANSMKCLWDQILRICRLCWIGGQRYKDGEFFDKAKKQFNNIRNVVNKCFLQKNINRDLGLLSQVSSVSSWAFREDWITCSYDRTMRKAGCDRTKVRKARFQRQMLPRSVQNHEKSPLYQIVTTKGSIVGWF